MRRGALLALGIVGIAFNWFAENWQVLVLVTMSAFAVLIGGILVFDAFTQRRLRREIALGRYSVGAQRPVRLESVRADTPKPRKTRTARQRVRST